MSHATPVRVRFAPSPTGYLHIGGARTALFNWLWARQTGGAFILRIEDTDEQRSTEESTRAILDSLLWLGITWDEGPDPDPARFGESSGPYGPYFQSQREKLHLQAAERLLTEGKAFYCPASEAEMTLPDGKKRLFSPYRDLPADEQREAFMKATEVGSGLPLRFRCPRSAAIEWHDLIRGEVRFDSEEIGDFIIWKSSGQVLYNFAAACDDHDMEITHVLRGEDHISNTPKQLLLYDALGWPRPVFGHVPLILGMDRARLSKRHGATRVEAYREMGVLAEALANFLLLIGWAPGGLSEALNRELFTRDEMIRLFHVEEVGKSSGAFNLDKLLHFNGLYIRGLSPEEFFERLRPYLPTGWLEHRGEDYARCACTLYQDKLTLLSEIEQSAWYFFIDPALRSADEEPPDAEDPRSAIGFYNAQAVAKFLTGNPDAPRVLGGLFDLFDKCTEWTQDALTPLVEGFCGEIGLGKAKVMQPWRVALTGNTMSPGFYDLLSVLGSDTVLRRVQPWIGTAG
jgi:glutamyl-tRNA synthetase